MLQRILMIVIIVLLLLGGGYYAYTQLMPEPIEEASGPIYSTQPAIKGDIAVGVEAVGPLNPSNGGELIVPGAIDYTGTSSTSYIISEILAEEGTEVKKGDPIIKLAAPDLHTQIDALQEEIRLEKESLASLMNVPVEEVDYVNPSNGITLKSPIDGRIVELNTVEGKKLEQGEIVARIVDDSRFEIIAKLTSDEFARISENSTAVLRFSQFSGEIPAKIVDINPNPIPQDRSTLEGGGESGQYEFVYWVTLEGENPGLIQPGMSAAIGFNDPDNDRATNWIKYNSNVEKFVEEERVLSSADGTVTEVFVHKMETVKKGDPIISLAGQDVRSQIEEKINKINQKQIELQSLSNQIGMLEVLAPMDGVVANVHRQPGQTVRPGEWLGSVYTTSEMNMWVQVDDVDILLVKQGSPVEVTVDALPDKSFEGEVAWVGTMGRDQNGVTRFEVSINVKGGEGLRPGMQANAYIKAGEAKDVLLIPLEAIFQEDGQNKVEILQPDGTPKIATVELGLMNDRYAEVKSGINEGEHVITGSTADLLPSQKIKSNNLLPNDGKDDEDNDGNNGNDDENNTETQVE